MRAEVHNKTGKIARQAMLRRYGWGVPTEHAVLTSSRNAVTLVAQDEFVPQGRPCRCGPQRSALGADLL
jgi:hypothetical protein